MKKNTIALIARGDNKWIGGLYYIKNICYMLAQNPKLVDRYRILVMCSKEHISEFIGLNEVIEIKGIDNFDSKKTKLMYAIYRFTNRIILFYPIPTYKFSKFMRKLGCTSAWWIPDFQDSHFPENFSEDELKLRNKKYKSIANDKLPLILSSQDSLNDFGNYYSQDRQKTYVVPFVSYIENDIKKLSDRRVNEVLKKYNLYNNEYILVANQFWKHKNHVVVFEALKFLVATGQANCIKIVFTGNMQDYRNPEYIAALKKYFEIPQISKYIMNLGFISREEQLAVMRKSKFIIQPSLFEGWGTVVEDAKVLDKLILLSDIPVHNEQMNENCILFDPYDSKDLAGKIVKMCGIVHNDDVKKGICDMHRRAELYSNEFLRLLDDVENTRRRK